MLGYFIVHYFEHAWPAHFHFGEETHADEFVNPRVAYTALAGLTIHTFFDGVSITSGFLISPWLGTVIFGATLLHNVPEGFTMASIMVAAGRSRKAGMAAVGVLGVSRILGVLGMALAHRWVNYGPGAFRRRHAVRGGFGLDPRGQQNEEPEIRPDRGRWEWRWCW